MSSAFVAYTNKTKQSREAFATALGKLFMGPQGPAAAELVNLLLADQKSRFAVEFNNILTIHLGRMYRDAVLAQMTSPSKE